MNEALAAKLAELSARFRDQAAEEALVLGAALARGDRQAVAERAHKLAGNAGMFGQPEISDAALELELAVESGSDLAVKAQRLVALLAAL